MKLSSTRRPWLPRILFTTVLLVLITGSAFAQGQPGNQTAEQVLGELPVQSGGRLKPLDTLARESVRLVTGRAELQGRDPVMTLLAWWADPEKTLALPLVECRDLQVKEELALDTDRRWYSLEELSSNSKLVARRDQIRQRLQAEEELQGADKKVQEVLVKMATLSAAMDGSLMHAVPNPTGLSEPWGSFADLEQTEVVAQAADARVAVGALRSRLKEGKPTGLLAESVVLRDELRRLGPVPDQASLRLEMRYNSSHPFRKAWMLYLAGFVALAFVKPSPQRGNGYYLGLSLVVAGFLVHIYGFVLRCIIAGRPPVTNMYESVIWVAFGAVFFALVLEYASAKKYYLMSASGAAVICLILADTLPTVLDPSIHPLTPVLRSNFWLTIHVLSITLGYAAFMLALGLGHGALWKSAFRPEQKDHIASLHDAVYKAVQIGVVFLAAGTILGGVWANSSWGRFWGWDPKEVWALIALLGYLAVLHGRYAGWLRKFGVSAWSVIAFQGVLMAWYGVNYVLGAGLHFYGFGSGGGRYVAYFVAFELLFVAWTSWRYRCIATPEPTPPLKAGGCPFSALSRQEQTTQGDT